MTDTVPRLTHLTGDVGLYYCCFRMSLLGWNVMPTARNARGVDIVACSQDASRVLTIQVKALSKRNPVPLGSSLDKVMGNFWVVVTGIAKAPAVQPKAYILAAEQVLAGAVKGDKDGRVSYWLQPSAYDTQCSSEAWDLIGSGF